MQPTLRCGKKKRKIKKILTLLLSVQLGSADGVSSAKAVYWYKGVSPIYDGGRYNSSVVTKDCPSNKECHMLQIDSSTPDDIGEYAVLTVFERTSNGEVTL